jgi:hypothetical protein
VILDNTTKNLAGLELASDPTQRISAYEAAGSSETISLDFTDGAVHQTELYLADLDHKNRTETVDLVDNVTGAVLDGRVVSNFSKGQYLIYDLRGNVSLRIINDSGPGAVYSGVFFDTPTTSPATYIGTDTTTAGSNWRSTYGSQGAIVVGSATQLPSYVSSFSVTGQTTTVLKSTTHAAAALQKITDINSNIEACWSTATHMDLNLSTSDGLEHDVTLYLADYDNKHRQERVQVIDAPTGNVLTQQDVSGFTKGQFITFRFSGSVIVRIISTAGPSAVVSGVFFDAPFGQKASFLGTDTTSGGNWKASQYGLSTAFIVGDNFPQFDDPGIDPIAITGAAETVLADPSSNPAALLRADSGVGNTHVAAYLYSNTSMVLAYNPGDFLIHTVALYFADFQNYHRQEVVKIYDPATLALETTQVVSNFSKGKYLLFDISGQALITISNGGYPNAVLSGVFTN